MKKVLQISGKHFNSFCGHKHMDSRCQTKPHLPFTSDGMGGRFLFLFNKKKKNQSLPVAYALFFACVCIYWAPFSSLPCQSHTSCCSDARCRARSHKAAIHWVLGRSVLLTHHLRSTNLKWRSCCQVIRLLCGRWLVIWADPVGPGEGLSQLWTVVVEWSMCWWRGGKKIITLLMGGKDLCMC